VQEHPDLAVLVEEEESAGRRVTGQ
jgi:hypothetical protein